VSSSRVGAVALVAAVTEPTRRQLLDLLLERGESTPTSLADGLPVTRQAVSKHLAVLDRAGLVDGERIRPRGALPNQRRPTRRRDEIAE
jgi:DNA-binding transcriptional ArsR family regulator